MEKKYVSGLKDLDKEMEILNIHGAEAAGVTVL